MSEAINDHIYADREAIEEFVNKTATDPDLPVDSSDGYAIQKVSSTHGGAHFNRETPATMEDIVHEVLRRPRQKFRRGMPLEAIVRERVNKLVKSRKKRNQRKTTRRAQRKK